MILKAYDDDNDSYRVLDCLNYVINNRFNVVSILISFIESLRLFRKEYFEPHNNI